MLKVAIAVIAYLVVTYFLLLAPDKLFLAFVRLYLWVITTSVIALAGWFYFKAKSLSRPKPLPEIEKRFEEELKQLLKEWEERKSSER